jgi:hypothetical protein
VSGTVRATLGRASPARIARRPTRAQLIKAGTTTVVLLFAFFALPELLSLYYVDTMTQVAVYSMVTLALGLLASSPAWPAASWPARSTTCTRSTSRPRIRSRCSP